MILIRPIRGILESQLFVAIRIKLHTPPTMVKMKMRKEGVRNIILGEASLIQ